MWRCREKPEQRLFPQRVQGKSWDFMSVRATYIAAIDSLLMHSSLLRNLVDLLCICWEMYRKAVNFSIVMRNQ